MIVDLKLGEIDQGTIFTCGYAEDYEGCVVCGLVITARCDIAQDKFPVCNYLPVVALDNWLHRDGCIILASRIERRCLGAMRNSLKTAGYAESILTVQAPRSVLEMFFPERGKDRKSLKARKVFKDEVEQYELAVECSQSRPKDKKVTSLASNDERERERLIRGLIQQNLTGYYFLPKVESNGDDLGYVVLMREVRHIPRALAIQIANGLDVATYDQMLSGNPSLAGRLVFDDSGFSMPIGQLTSPTLEHLMQNFSLLFTRIGVADPDTEYIEEIWTRQPSVKGV